ncbi:MAG: hypothetical protein KKF67_01825, partial [Nanoarchaeota archaeon]|nr:hypothetical protein [Nanoarchaeota archaeon]
MISAKANMKINELDAVIVGFNVKIEEDARLSQTQFGSPKLGQTKEIKENIKILTDNVIYKLIENLMEFREEKRKEIEKNRLMELATICKLEILRQYVFRNSNPAIFGVKVIGGKIRSGLNIINGKSEKIGRIKNIQSENKSVGEATESMEIAVSVPGVNFERVLKETQFLYSEISESQFRKFKKNKDLLSENEKKILMEIAEIKRQKKSDWGV